MTDIGKRILADYLGYLKYKVEHDGLTLEEGQALLRVFEDSIHMSATTDDLAAYYGRSNEAVRAVISRKMLSKPKRRVTYSFNEFRSVLPDKWKK